MRDVQLLAYRFNFACEVFYLPAYKIKHVCGIYFIVNNLLIKTAVRIINIMFKY